MKNLERIFKAFANKRRLAILAYLKNEKEASVGEIAAAIRLSLKATSKHLAILTAADFLDREQRSLQMFYRLNPSMPAAANHILSLL
jgi:DNA-binding transcriptional ArsR family regulator